MQVHCVPCSVEDSYEERLAALNVFSLEKRSYGGGGVYMINMCKYISGPYSEYGVEFPLSSLQRTRGNYIWRKRGSPSKYRKASSQLEL